MERISKKEKDELKEEVEIILHEDIKSEIELDRDDEFYDDQNDHPLQNNCI